MQILTFEFYTIECISRPIKGDWGMFLFFSVISLFVDLQINQVTQQLKVSISDLV